MILNTNDNALSLLFFANAPMSGLNICVCSIVENWAEKGKNSAIYKL